MIFTGKYHFGNVFNVLVASVIFIPHMGTHFSYEMWTMLSAFIKHNISKTAGMYHVLFLTGTMKFNHQSMYLSKMHSVAYR